MTSNERDIPTEGADCARWRSALYRLASFAFLVEPTDEWLCKQVAAARSALRSDSGWTLLCERDILIHLAAFDASNPRLGTEVRSEYAELFVGPRPPRAPLYESIYVGYPRRLMTETTLRVREAYERGGFTVAKRNKIPDDHIGYELEFLANLCTREACAIEEGCVDDAVSVRLVQERFLRDHLSAWAGLFHERVIQAGGQYYCGWSRFVCDWVAEDVAYIVEESECGLREATEEGDEGL